jgi:hypothetical protein
MRKEQTNPKQEVVYFKNNNKKIKKIKSQETQRKMGQIQGNQRNITSKHNT